MVVLTTSETATARVLAVLANATVTGGDVAAVLSCVGEPRRHLRGADKQESKFSCMGCIRAQDTDPAQISLVSLCSSDKRQHGERRARCGGAGEQQFGVP